MIDLTPILQALVGVLAALITAYVIPFIKNKTEGTKWEKLLSLAMTGVEAAEQLYRDSGSGDEKKAYVKAFLEQHGYTADLDVVIEAAVKKLTMKEDE